jgi:uncharacterized protein (DUF1800 family)
MSTRDAVTALRRFGLGARPGEIRRIASDPRGFVAQTLAQGDAALLTGATLAPSHVTLASLMQARREKRAAAAPNTDADRADRAKNMPPSPAPELPSSDAAKAAPRAPPAEPALSPPRPGQIRRQAFVEEAVARFGRAARADAALLERLVIFWSNHFCVSANKGPVASVAGAYEREAVRPYVLGRFADMLLAVERHPAMLIYLDNAQSIGPNSRAGVNRGRGLNENLAREILELHTLGVDGGYSQEDVTNLARILTGWTVGNFATPLAEPGRFFFARGRHEPGDWMVLGKRYPDYGERTGENVLRDLARHPSTARRVAGKLARHFVSDSPPAALVEQLERTFLASEGNLRAVMEALIKSPQVWEAPPAKVLPPYDFLVAVARGIGFQPRPLELLRLTNILGQPLWRPPSPAGWPDTDDGWASPSAMRERLRVAEVAARRGGASGDPREVAQDVLGDAIGASTRQAVARAEAREQGLELLIMSPEFQRR